MAERYRDTAGRFVPTSCPECGHNELEFVHDRRFPDFGAYVHCLGLMDPENTVQPLQPCEWSCDVLDPVGDTNGR